MPKFDNKITPLFNYTEILESMEVSCIIESLNIPNRSCTALPIAYIYMYSCAYTLQWSWLRTGPSDIADVREIAALWVYSTSIQVDVANRSWTIWMILGMCMADYWGGRREIVDYNGAHEDHLMIWHIHGDISLGECIPDIISLAGRQIQDIC